MSDWAPYQSSTPEDSRQSFLSPSTSPRPSTSTPPPNSNYSNNNNSPWNDYISNGGPSSSNYAAQSSNGGREYVNQFETSLPIRMDFEAMMAYILLPPAGGVLLLLLEHKSDYVRYHAWQSALLFSALFIVHIIFSFNHILSWILFTFDLIVIAYLSLRAYQDADSLDRFEVPFFGQLANSYVDDE